MHLPIAALENPPVQASRESRRARAVQSAAPAAALPRHAHAVPETGGAVAAAGLATGGTPARLDLLSDQYAEERLQRALAEYRAAARNTAASTGANAGAADSLLPLQPYRLALGSPPVEQLATLAAPALRRPEVPRIENAALDDGFENSRRRRQLAN